MKIAHLVAVVHIHLAAHHARVGGGEPCGYGFVVNSRVAALHRGRVGDVAVVGDATALFVQEVVVVEKTLKLISVANV